MARKIRWHFNYLLGALLGMLGFNSCLRVMYGPEPPMYGPAPMYGPPVEEWYSPISVQDQSTDDWEAVADKTAVAVSSPENSHWQALQVLKVYADKEYINICCEFSESHLKNRDYVPFRIYLNADGDDLTGGGAHLFADGNAEVLLEGAVFIEKKANDYNPAVYQWFGGEGGGISDQNDPAGEHWINPYITPSESNNWGAVVGAGKLPIGRSQVVGNQIEIQLWRQFIPYPFADTFSIGVEIQQDWQPAGVLPNAADDADRNPVPAEKLVVTIDQ